jgi:hypothetical protein
MKDKSATFAGQKKNSETSVPKASRFFLYLFLAALLLGSAAGALAKDGRDFAGSYAVSKVHSLGEPQDKSSMVEVTLTIRVFNYSDQGDINEPVLQLLGSERSTAAVQQFTTVKTLPGKHGTIVTGQFTIDRAEYQSWGHHGNGPNVVVIYKDESGRTLTQRVQLSRRPGLPPPPAN